MGADDFGGFTFAERPDIWAPDARIVWSASLDPGILRVLVSPAPMGDPEAIDPAALAPWLTLVVDAQGREHAVLSDGWHHIRLDVVSGSLVSEDPLLLRYRLKGLAEAEAKVLPLRRFLALCRNRRFAASLFPNEPRVERWLEALRVSDALRDGASQRDIAIALFGAERIAHSDVGGSDSLRSRVKRVVRLARSLAAGGYRSLMRMR